MRRTILTLALIGSGVPALAQTPPPAPHGGPMRGLGGAMLMRADADHDGAITREEATAQADMRFDLMDANRDGVVTQDEMRDARMAMRTALRDRANADGTAPPPSPGARPDRGSGPDRRPVEMTREASRARAMTAFDRIDTNRDGRIDRAEMAQMRDAWRDRRGARDDMPPPAPQQ